MNDDAFDLSGSPPKPRSAEEKNQLDEMFSRMVKSEERDQLERTLLDRIKSRKEDLAKMLRTMNDHWTYEDGFYRFYHGSFKVYGIQDATSRAVSLLGELLPERKLNVTFARIVREGTGKQFEMEHNADWGRHTRPMLEAFMHARYMVEMAVRYADIPAPPQPMPSGYAALLYLYDLR
jgi:hypothetical protein